MIGRVVTRLIALLGDGIIPGQAQEYQETKRGTAMNRKITVLLIAACCIALATTLIAQAGSDASSKVEQLEKEMRDAQKASDVSWYQQHLADGYVEGHSWGEWATKDQTIKETQDKGVKI